MDNFWQRMLAGPALAAGVSLIAWVVWDRAAALIVFSALVLALLLHNLRNLAALYRWLQRPDPQRIPSTTGIWDALFAMLYRLTRAQTRSQQELAVALRRFQEAATVFPDGIVILDHQDRIQWCNPTAEQHFGIDSRLDMGQQITNLVRHPRFVEYLDAQNYREPLVIRLERELPLMASIQLIPYGDTEKLLISRDITSLERAETMRRDFVANVSHELRTPLTVVGGFLETLADSPEMEPEMLRRSLELMRQQTQRMQRLVEDLLALSQLENAQHPLREEKVDVPELVRLLHYEAQSLSGGRHRIGLEIETEDWLLGSPDELRSAFSNLISNAIRYTPEGGRIDLRWRKEGGQLVFSVQDTGIGIEAHHLPRLTERFYRVDRSRSRETGGTGLGLAIVKHVLSRHQGVLEIESEPGKGSRFSARFPESRCIQPEQAPAMVGRAGSGTA
ncbi:phosphate regulon sensor histidine kinase PhoR [Pelomicrobium methylotrophicum]|nr:phosphate regulon sensor histidine kinase PhoR [Pelomicrobium methylotrophicum]